MQLHHHLTDCSGHVRTVLYQVLPTPSQTDVAETNEQTSKISDPS